MIRSSHRWHSKTNTTAPRRPPAVLAVAVLLFAATVLVTVSTAQVINLPLVRNPHGQLAQIKRGLQSIAKRGEGEQQQQRRNTTALALIHSVHREFFVQVEIGTPPQPFNLTLDTASSSLWVPSAECSQARCPYGRYIPSKSSTFHNSNISFLLNYNAGSINGTYCTETVSLGGFKIQNQSVALANTVNGSVFPDDDHAGNGVIGFAYPGQTASRGFSNDVPFVFNLVKQGLIAKPVFSVSLDNGISGGELTLGGINPTKYNGTLSYAPALLYSASPDRNRTTRTTRVYWAVAGVGMATSTGYQATLRTMEEFVLDTGSTLTYSPHAEAIIKSLNLTYTVDRHSGAYVVNCTNQQTIHNATVEFQVARTLLGSHAHRYRHPIKITAPVQNLLLPGDAETLDEATTCLFGILPAKEKRTIIGESVLRSVYTVYDIGHDRIGFAPVAESGRNSTTSPPL